nr:TonB-dependent receptor [Sphingomonas sp. Y57]
MSYIRLNSALSCVSALAFMSFSTCAYAQTSQGEDGEIVVTARGKREELQRAPASITAFSAKQIEDARIKTVSDFIARTPNISIVEAQSIGTSFITIRGISQVSNGESPVAVVIDGVQQVSSRQFTGDLFDVQQIEVLRGPQGALYGRNAIGGAIVITSKQPTNDFHFDANVSAGNGGDYRAQAAVSGPIVEDKLLFRLAGSFRNFGGLLHNVYLDKTVDWLHDRNVRGRLKAFLTETLTADVKASYTHTRASALQYHFQPTKFASPTSCFADPADPFGGPAPDADAVKRSFCSNIRGTNARSIATMSVRLQKTMDWGTITNTFAAIKVKEFAAGDGPPYSASLEFTQAQFELNKSWQNELRIASSPDNRLRWVVGGYYLRTNRFISSASGVDTGDDVAKVTRDPRYTATTNTTLSFLADRNRNEAYAFFGDLSYDLTTKLELSAALRYDHDHRHQIIDPRSSAGVPAGCAAGGGAACARKANFSKAQPKFTLNYRPDANLTLFADWGIGFRSGQFNQAGAAAATNVPGASDLAKAESASTTEAGFKASLLGGRLHIDAAGYYTSDKNPFYYVFVPAAAAQILLNVDKVELYGGEIGVTLTPVKGLDIFGSYGYTHSKIKKYAANLAAVGNWAPYIPRDSGNIGAQYRFPITNAYNVLARAEMEHHGKQYWDPENSSARSAFQLFNLRTGFESADGRWSLTGYVSNVTDKKYNVAYQSGGFVQPARPRTYGVELSAKF